MLLGYFIPAVNLPLFLYNVYQTVLHLQEGMVIGSQMFWEDIIVLVSTLFLTWAIPRFFPVYTSKYVLTPDGFKISRLLRKAVSYTHLTLPTN